jgi:hypothetical protein
VDDFTSQLEQLLNYLEQNAGSLNGPTQQMIVEFLGEVNELINAPIESTIPTSAGMLWYISGGNPQVFTDYLKQIPDPELNGLLNNQVQLKNVIRRLSENQPQERNREVQGIPQAPIQSSNIWGFSYEPADKKLYVRFQGDGIYEYDGVPPQVFNLFQQGAIPAKTDGQNQYGRWWKGKSPSLGASLFELIKQRGYPYQKVA